MTKESESLERLIKGLKPTHNRILVYKDGPIEKVGSIYVAGGQPDKRALQSGRVLSMGPGVLHQDGHIHEITCCGKGDQILFAEWAGSPVHDEFGKPTQLVLITDGDVFAVLPK